MNGGGMNGFHGVAAFPPQAAVRNGVFVPSRILIPLSLAIFVLMGLQGKALVTVVHQQSTSSSSSNNQLQSDPSAVRFSNNIHSLKQGGHTAINHKNNDDTQCRWYLAESAIPHGGLGVFTATGLHQGDTVGFPDLCIFVSDAPDHWTHLRSHTFGGGSFFGQYEGRNSRAACEGFATTYNTAPDRMVNTALVSPVLPTHAGTARQTSPGAGAISHHFGIHGRAVDVITAGSELTINYGDWDFDENKVYVKPTRPVPWLREHGWCIDNIEIGLSRIPDAGRGAFARVPLPRNTVVAPAPLQCFENRKIFQKTTPEQLYVNYCLQPADSHMIFYPYGPAVNLINHSRHQPNVKLQWSQKPQHHAAWLDLDYDDFWKITSPGGLILEVVALTDIAAGDELLLDYGPAWEAAWQQHVQQWKPPPDAAQYVYPAQLDETEPLRTVAEQERQPYPSNLHTMCIVSDWERQRGPHVQWTEPTDFSWWEGMCYCHILERQLDAATGDFVYTTEPIFTWNPKHLKYNPAISDKDRLKDFGVPRRAIRFLEIPYMDDEHLPNAFRHPIELPAHLVPDAWRNNKVETR